MKPKTKLMVILGVLFVLVILLATLNQILITRLTEEARKITIENNTSIDYAEQMLQALDTLQAYHQRQYFGSAGSSPDDAGRLSEYKRASVLLESNIRAEENNITEPGEKEAAANLRTAYNEYTQAFQTIDSFHRFDAVTYYVDLYPKTEKIRAAVYEILEINLTASNLKSKRHHELASQPASWIQTAGVLSAILALLIWMAGAYSLSDRKPEEPN